MTRWRYQVAAAGLALALPAAAQDPFGEDWPAGEGRLLTGALCGGCHSLELVKQQGLSRSAWDELLTWMTEKQNMNKLEGAMREQVLDYLAANFGVDKDAGQDAPAAEPLRPSGGQQGVSRSPLGIRPPD